MGASAPTEGDRWIPRNAPFWGRDTFLGHMRIFSRHEFHPEVRWKGRTESCEQRHGILGNLSLYPPMIIIPKINVQTISEK